MIENIQIKSQEKSTDLIGIGNAIVDIIVNVNDEFLKINQLEKGSMNLIEIDKSEELLKNCQIIKKIAGGSTANTVFALATLGNKVEFIGRVKDDYYGKNFSDSIKKSGAIFNSKLVISNKSSAHSVIFVTPDAQRTMCTYLGASIEFEPNDLNKNSIKQSKYLYLEGYLWDSDLAKKAFIDAAKIAKESNTKIILSLSDSFCVDRHRESFIDLIKEYIDILFCNESELKSLIKDKEFDDCKKYISSICELSIVTLGKEGSLIIKKNKVHEINSVTTGKVIDTTGAGDIYAGGFLHGLINDYPLHICGNFGSICAGHIITQLGSRPNIDLKKLLKEKS
tara:strand:- start:26509 stop:27522 length:1014 start_codon:yes stop_codon:yes gene_type:complete